MALEALATEDRQQLIMSVGTHRGERHLSPVEVAELLQQAVQAGDSVSDIAKAVGLNNTQVSRFLSVLKLPSDVRHLVDWGKSDASLAFTSAFELSRLDDADDEKQGVEAVLQHSLSTSEVRSLVQSRKRSAKPLNECVQGVLKMRPKIEVRHVFIGAVLDERVRQRLRGRSQEQRDQLLKAILGKSLPNAKASGRLGVDRFTLVGGPDLGAVIKAQKAKLETEINARLGEVLSK